MSRKSFRVSLLATSIAALASFSSAQQIICFSVDGIWPATGSNGSTPSRVVCRVNGVTVTTNPSNGQTADSVSSAQEAGFRAAGFAVNRTSSNFFCLTAGPGGAPLKLGGIYGTDDQNLGLDTRTATLAWGQAGANIKRNGVLVAIPAIYQPPQPFGGVVTLLLEKTVNGTAVPMTVTITLPANMWGTQLQSVIGTALQANGLRANRVQWLSALNPGTLVDGYLIDRTITGDEVNAIEVQLDATSRRLLPNETGSGLFPVHGATEFGRGTRGNASREPWAYVTGRPTIGGSFSAVFDVGLANAPGGFLVGLLPATTPVAFAGGWLLVEPALATFQFAISNASGTMTRPFTVPYNANLVGLPLHVQAGVVDAGGTLTLSPAIAAFVGDY